MFNNKNTFRKTGPQHVQWLLGKTNTITTNISLSSFFPRAFIAENDIIWYAIPLELFYGIPLEFGQFRSDVLAMSSPNFLIILSLLAQKGEEIKSKSRSSASTVQVKQ